jgi:HK97 family phage prohead protease
MIRRAFGLTDVEIRSEARILVGTVVPYNQQIRVGGYLESFAKGAFTTDTAVPLLVAHRHAHLPIGASVQLVDEDTRLAGEFVLSDTRDADEVLALAKDGVPLGLSVGFAPITDNWSADRKSVVRLRAHLAEISVVGVPAYADARIEAVRAAQRQPAPLLAIARRW